MTNIYENLLTGKKRDICSDLFSEASKQAKELNNYFQKELFTPNNGKIVHTSSYLNWTGDLVNNKKIWPLFVSSLTSIANGQKTDLPGWKKIQNNNFEYHIRGAYKVIYSWEGTKDNKKLLVKALGHSSHIMPVMNSIP